MGDGRGEKHRHREGRTESEKEGGCGSGGRGEETRFTSHWISRISRRVREKDCEDRMLGTESRVHEETQAPVLN